MIESPVALFRFWGAEGDEDEQPDAGNEPGDEAEEDASDESPERDEDAVKPPAPKSGKPPARPAPQDDEDEESAEDQLAKLKRENIRLKKAAEQKEEDAKVEKDLGKRLAKAEANNKKYERLMATTFIEHQILKNAKYQWHDVEDVRAAIDPDSINVNMETGEVEGLDIELKRIAKKKPHYLKNNEEEPEEEPQPAGRGRRPAPQGRQPTGGHPFGGRTKEGETDRQKLMNKYKIGPQFVGGNRIG